MGVNKKILKYDFYIKKINENNEFIEKAQKQKIKKYKEKIDEYKKNKSIIKQIFDKNKNDEKKINDELEKILNKNGEINDFLLDYVKLCKYEYKIKKMNDYIVDCKMKIDDYKADKELSFDDNVKSKIDEKIKKLNDEIIKKSKEIIDTKNELNTIKREHEMKIKNAINDINSESKK